MRSQIEDVTNAFNKNKDDSGLLPVAELGTALRMLGHVLDKEGLIILHTRYVRIEKKISAKISIYDHA